MEENNRCKMSKKIKLTPKELTACQSIGIIDIEHLSNDELISLKETINDMIETEEQLSLYSKGKSKKAPSKKDVINYDEYVKDDE